MSLALGNSTDNKIYIDGTGGISIGSIISGSSKQLSLNGSGSGTLTLGAANIYSGNTVINSGTLALGTSGTFANSPTIIVGSAGSSGTVLNLTAKTAFSFASTQTVKGIGTINIGSGKTVTLPSGSTLAPGNSIGTLNFTGNLALAGTYQAELGTPNASAASGVSDRAAVTGDLTLTGSTLSLVDNAGANSQGSAGAGAYRLATYTGTLTGTFGTITNPLSATLHEKVTYGPASGGGSVDLALYRLATGSTASTLDLGKARVGDTLSGSFSVTNSASADGFSEKLNSTAAVTSGDVSSTSGSISQLAAGASSSSLGVSLNTATSGAKSGTSTVSFVSDGTGTSGYATTANGSQVVTVSGTVYDIAQPSFSKTSGDGTFSGSASSYSLDFGTVATGATYTATINLTNTQISLFQDALAGDYAYTGSGSIGATAVGFSGLAAGSSNSVSVSFTPGSAGSFSGSLKLQNLLSTQSGLADFGLSDITISISGSAIPEPTTYATLLGLVAAGSIGLRRRRRV